MKFVTYTLSEIGGRTKNEDAFGERVLDTGEACWVVADGLGGHGGGDIAAQTAVHGFLKSFTANPIPLIDTLHQHIEAAHQAIVEHRISTMDACLTKMRTTLVALVTDGHYALWVHVGYSRLYVLRDDTIVKITRDHSVTQALVNTGEILPADIRYHQDRNRLLRDLGGDAPIRPEISPNLWILCPGDRFLLCLVAMARFC